jgi:pyruvate dehydrogenase E2 component (dihydrolipoamide acetyltransferase)
MFARNRARREQEPGARDAGPVLTAAQQAAARRLTQSKQSIPHFYLSRPVVMEAVLWARETLTPPPVWDAFIVHALARAGTAFPRFRCRYEDGSLVPVPEAGIGVAVDLDGDLHVITVQAAEGKGVAEISAEIRAGVDALRAGDSSVRKPCERWVTVSNLGSTGVEEFAAIINPPETAILALGRTRRVPVVSDTGDVVAVWRAGLTLSVDHRVVSGLYAARFLDAVAASLEEPAD